MEEIIEAITDWPVIAQAVFGSALFWIIIQSGQKVTEKISQSLSKSSREMRISWLVSQQAKYVAATTTDTDMLTIKMSVLIYRSLRQLVKAFIWLTLGLALNSIAGLSGIIGFMGCLYHLFRAYEIISPIKDVNDDEGNIEKLNKIRQELSSIEKT
ncbi:hypothetical protein NAV33_03495 [Pseudomonas stutzeri]|uniref:hypothetical protein n=1 Tax=Stutzerimonas stutzeri TaxID=316 RepID=UPI00210A65FD|nr:hypothetical protein [Stutzerimonas stutzeri]MCQ4310965.1 hypothetical protein [Stutzerimonas stutzeri]